MSKDWQITGKRQTDIDLHIAHWNRSSRAFYNMVKHVPIQVWSEVKPGQVIPYLGQFVPNYIHNSGGKTYLVTEINNQDRAGI